MNATVPAWLGVVLLLAALAGGMLYGGRLRSEAEGECASRGGVLERFDRATVCVQRGAVLR